MLDRRLFKLILFFLLLGLSLLCCCFYLFWEFSAARPVERISPQTLAGMEHKYLVDFSMLRYKGQPAPFDKNNEVLLLPCDLDSEQLFEGLSCLDMQCRLYLVDEPASRDLSAAMASGAALHLAVCRGNSYQLVNLAVTSFPVLSLQMSSSFIDDRGHAAYRGEVHLSAPGDMESLSSICQWNVRGVSSATREKKAWKLELQDIGGSSTQARMLDLGSDSDWILNSMVFDTLNMREMLSMELWNSYIYPDYQPYRMSQARYVELLFDGEYMGLYMLQNRIDEEYLGLDKSRSMLFKHGTRNEELSLQENYELVYSPYSFERSYELLDQALSDTSSIDIMSLMNMQLYIDYLSSWDNAKYKNMYFIVDVLDEGYRISYLPWDTDLSLGIDWNDSRGSVLDYEASVADTLMHREYRRLLSSRPEFERELALLWQQQRRDVYSEESLLSLADSIHARLEASGALLRDEMRWGSTYRWEDSFEQLRGFISTRLDYLDRHFAAILEQ
ncbi:MAG: CotH kinase family protein [Oscillospiraceae bacterium]|nr:CotH kinase family protein [Oscillospiraceae bacterium]